MDIESKTVSLIIIAIQVCVAIRSYNYFTESKTIFDTEEDDDILFK